MPPKTKNPLSGTATSTTDRVSVHPHWGIHLVAGLGSQMMETDAGKLESVLRDFFNEEF